MGKEVGGKGVKEAAMEGMQLAIGARLCVEECCSGMGCRVHQERGSDRRWGWGWPRASSRGRTYDDHGWAEMAVRVELQVISC